MIELQPLIRVILGGLFIALFLISAARNSGSDEDEDDDESQRARDDDV